MEKTEIRPLFQLMASWPEKSNFEGVKTFLGPKKFRGYPILGFLTLKSTKKILFLIKNVKKFTCWIIEYFWFFQAKNPFLLKQNCIVILLYHLRGCKVGVILTFWPKNFNFLLYGCYGKSCPLPASWDAIASEFTNGGGWYRSSSMLYFSIETTSF